MVLFLIHVLCGHVCKDLFYGEIRLLQFLKAVNRQENVFAEYFICLSLSKLR